MTSRRRKLLTVALASIVAFVALCAYGVAVYMRPQLDSLAPADVIIVLGGDGSARYDHGVNLAQQDYAPYVLLSAPVNADQKVLTRLCQRSHQFTVICFHPNPETTRGEARELRDQAASHGWNSAIVVTSTPHISRARYIITRCFRGRVSMVASPDPLSPADWAFAFVYQTGGYLTALLQDGC